MSKENNCLVTGSTGFLGKHALPELNKHFNISTVSLRKTAIKDIALQNIDSIIHLAGLAHQMQKVDDNLYFEVNKEQTLKFAQRAKENGVKHFVFISTVKVYGDDVNETVNENSACHPTDPYGQSKFEAEQGLAKLADDNFLVSIVRPPLIYGSGVKGNLDRIIKLCMKLPVLPFGKIDNERSMVYAGNVTALIIHLIEQKAAGIFIAGDQDRKSTTALVDMISEKMKLRKSNLAIPGIIRLLLKILKPAIHQRLFSDFIIDNAETNKRLQFKPPYSFEEGINNMVSPYLNL